MVPHQPIPSQGRDTKSEALFYFLTNVLSRPHAKHLFHIELLYAKKGGLHCLSMWYTHSFKKKKKKWYTHQIIIRPDTYTICILTYMCQIYIRYGHTSMTATLKYLFFLAFKYLPSKSSDAHTVIKFFMERKKKLFILLIFDKCVEWTSCKDPFPHRVALCKKTKFASSSNIVQTKISTGQIHIKNEYWHIYDR